jgi:hypothetical protein
MELTYVSIVILASMIFLLSGMVGFLYWQQNRLLQHVQSIALVISTHYSHPQEESEEEKPAVEDVPSSTEEEEEEEDDRLPVETVEGPPVVDTKPSSEDVDDLQEKTVAQLRELLTQKGIPHGKRDSKPVLLQLLKATS